VPTYDVMIRATIRKTVRVEAADKDEAAREAHEAFTVTNEGDDEDYNEETLEVTEVKS
jgi:hypothetical protein